MGGGEGAKERRKLKRLGHTETPTERKTQQNHGRDFKQRKSSGPVKKYRPDANNPIAIKKYRPDAKLNKTEKKKVKKPKHLKRKLDQLAGDDESRQLVLKEMAKLEEQKRLLSKTPSNKRHKKSENKDFHTKTVSITAKDLGIDRRSNQDVVSVEHADTTRPADSQDHGLSNDDGKGEKDSTMKAEQDVVSAEHADTTRPADSQDHGVSNDDGKGEEDSTMKSEQDVVSVEHADTTRPADSQDHGVSNDDGKGEEDSTMKTEQDAAEVDLGEEADDIGLRRQRGRRRRGRKDTAKHIEEQEETAEVAEERQKDKVVSQDTGSNPESDDDKGRYCIGRKPVSDFAIGQKYPGKVVYVKPFGVFFDIGCHSDAFCHVSRLKDDFVDKSEDLFKEGDGVTVRVVEIDRKQKRITVSLQSDERVADEQASVTARQQRKNVRWKKAQRSSNSHDPSRTMRVTSVNPSTPMQNEASESSARSRMAERTPMAIPPSMTERTPRAIPPKDTLRSEDTGNMTPSELKRARKLARRATRREQTSGEA